MHATTIPGHTVDPLVTIDGRNAAKRERARRMVAQGRMTDAALLQRRVERLEKADTLRHYQSQLVNA